MLPNTNDNGIWHLELEGDIIATFNEVWHETPWFHGRIVNPPKFEHFRCLFSEDIQWDSQEVKDLFNEVSSKGDFILRHIRTNKTHDNIILHEDGDGVSFRCCEIESE
jgi:hypothetical protein